MSITTTQYAGHEALAIEAGAVRLVATTSVGPRVLALLTEDGANAFVEVPGHDAALPGVRPHPPARRTPALGSAGGPARHLPAR